jgi:hypothetical protein
MTVTEVAFAAAISVTATKQVVNQSGENPVNSHGGPKQPLEPVAIVNGS